MGPEGAAAESDYGMSSRPRGQVADVAVIIAAWNAERTLARAIESAAAQTVPVEICVVDDASTDGTLDVAKRMSAADPRITVRRQTKNLGPSAARNEAIEATSAPWIAVLDADDFMEPDRLGCLRGLARRKNADFVADDIWKQDEAGSSETRRRMLSVDTIGIRAIDAATFVAGNLADRHAGRQEMGFLKPLMSRSFLDRHALRYDEVIRLGEDYELYVRALLVGARFILTDPAGYVATVRTESLSGQHPTEAHKHLIDADRALLAREGLGPDARRQLRRHLLEHQKKWAWRRLIDAKRERDIQAAAACFWARPRVGLALLDHLRRDFWKRMTSRVSA